MENSFELVERESRTMLDQAREIVVESDEQYSEAGSFVMACKDMIAKIQAAFKDPKQKAFEAHRAITQMEKDTLSPVQSAMQIVSGVALSWKREQDRLAKEEADRIADEKRRADEEARLKEAERLEAAGKTKEAEKALEAPPAPRPTRFVSPAPRVAGLSTTKKWKARIVNPDKVTINYRLPDPTLINRKVEGFFKYAREPTEAQIKALADEIGGVVIEEVETFAGRVAR